MTAQRSFKLLVVIPIVLLIVGMFTACNQSLVPEDHAGFTLVFPSVSGARSLGKFDAVATWSIRGSNASAGSGFTKEFPGTAQTAVIENVRPGEWAIAIDGRDTGGVRLFFATDNCTLVAGDNTLNIAMVKDLSAIPKIEVSGPIAFGGAVDTLMEGLSIDFGGIYYNGPNHTIIFSIKNTGNSDLVLSLACTLTDGVFSIPAQPSNPVKPFAIVNFDVVFDPPNTGAGSRTDTLTISSNDPDIPNFVLNLTGSYSA